MQLYIDQMASPLGKLLVVASETVVCAVKFDDAEGPLVSALQKRFGPQLSLREADDPLAACSALTDYLNGDLTAVDTLPVDGGGTPFQARAWAALREIPAGTTENYGQLAARLGKPTASRAVGAANGRNPINIIVPCHRVIGADGSLTGYGGGLWRKRWLLAHEGTLPPETGELPL
ncbi:MAG: methylated-DNA--[protein]-cysteine S-methyltransferase [Alphaproteobacteria bacterium]|jgi:methylated-DNA-[protein]-cysteine S-methyltransferase|nr:methylated-DNA--[protein]-cysteine S-methyltransferase [Alphaproteobacteria bacterium]